MCCWSVLLREVQLTCAPFFLPTPIISSCSCKGSTLEVRTQVWQFLKEWKMPREETLMVYVAPWTPGINPGLWNTKRMFPTHCRDCIHPSCMAGAQMVCQTSKSVSVSGHSSHLLLYQPDNWFDLRAPVSGLGFERFLCLPFCIYQVTAAIWIKYGLARTLILGGWGEIFFSPGAKTQISQRFVMLICFPSFFCSKMTDLGHLDWVSF